MNMSYCMCENTNRDLKQVLDEVNLETISELELRHLRELKITCEQILEEFPDDILDQYKYVI